MAGQQFGYEFDSIGNRKTATRNGRTATYAADTVNQYDQQTVPGFVDVMGEATAAAKVTVNNAPTTRKGTYFHKEVEANNTTDPALAQLKTVAIKSNADAQARDAVISATKHAFLGDVNRRALLDRERDAVAGASVELDDFAFVQFVLGADDESGEIRFAFHVVDDDALHFRPECRHQMAHEIVGERALFFGFVDESIVLKSILVITVGPLISGDSIFTTFLVGSSTGFFSSIFFSGVYRTKKGSAFCTARL